MTNELNGLINELKEDSKNSMKVNFVFCKLKQIKRLFLMFAYNVDRFTVTELSEAVGCTYSTASSYVKELIESEFFEYVETDNKREKPLRLSDFGCKIMLSFYMTHIKNKEGFIQKGER